MQDQTVAGRLEPPERGLLGLGPAIEPLLHLPEVSREIEPPGLETRVVGTAHGRA